MKGLLLFGLAFIVLLIGFSVAFSFGGVALFYAMVTDSMDLFRMMPYRIWSLMTNITLMAVPLFIMMGIILQKSGMAERLLESMGTLFGRVRGGVAVSTVVVGAILAASTGVVGASVVAMAVIALPVMLKYKYDPKLAAGTICASGTLGQIIPPSIVLIILGEVLQVPVGDLFQAAALPGFCLALIYIVYILVIAFVRPSIAPALPPDERSLMQRYGEAFKAILPPLVLIVLVLGSIFRGLATPTESAAVGVVGAVVLTAVYRRFSFRMLFDAARETVKVTAMIFMILIGATAFSMVFSFTGGEEAVATFLTNLPGGEWGFLIISMLAIMLLGFFIDFVEISYIVVPILAPIAVGYGLDPVWFGILIALNLQTSFLTPPFGFALFYLKGAAPDALTTGQIYRGVTPFIALQVVVLLAVLFVPELFMLRGVE